MEIVILGCIAYPFIGIIVYALICLFLRLSGKTPEEVYSWNETIIILCIIAWPFVPFVILFFIIRAIVKFSMVLIISLIEVIMTKRDNVQTKPIEKDKYANCWNCKYYKPHNFGFYCCDKDIPDDIIDSMDKINIRPCKESIMLDPEVFKALKE